MFLSDQEIENQLVNTILKLNPHLQLGQRMTQPVMLAKEGKFIEIQDAEGEVGVGIESKIDNGEAIVASSVLFRLPINEPIKEKDVENFKVGDGGKYLHVYYCGIRNRAHLDNLQANLGKTQQQIDPLTFEIQEVIVTQAMIDHWNTCIFRYAISS